MQPATSITQTISDYPHIDQWNAEALRSRFSSLERVKLLAEMAIEHSRKAGYVRGQVEGTNNLAFVLFRNSEYVEATRLAHEVVGIAQEHWMAAQEGDARMILGSVRRKMGDYTGAFEELSAALSLGEQAQNDAVILASLNGIAIVYEHLGEYALAIEYFQRSLEFNTDPETADQNRAVCLNNCGVSYTSIGDYVKALECTQESRAIFQRMGDTFNQAITLMNVGNAYRLARDFDPALAFFQQALEVAAVHGETFSMTVITIGLTEAYLDMGNTEQALHHSAEALRQAKANGSTALIANAYRVAARASKQAGDYRAAYEHLENHRLAQDEIHNQQDTSRIKSMQAIHEVESARKELELHRLRNTTLELQIKDMEQAALIRHEQNRLMLALAQEHEFSQLKSQLMNRISHDLRTPLTIIQSSAGLVRDYHGRMSKEKLLQHIAGISDEIDRTIAIVDDIVRLAQQGDDLPEIARRKTDLRALCQQTMEEVAPHPQARSRVNIKVAHNATHELINPLLVSRSLSNVLANALSYSAPDSPVQVRVSRVHSQLIIRVQDSGIGIPPEEVEMVLKPMFRGSNVDNIPGSGLGLTIAYNCITAHRGTLEIGSAPTGGTIITLRLPVPA